MLLPLATKSLFAVCLTVLRPCLASVQYSNMSTSEPLDASGSKEAGVYSAAFITVPNIETGKKLAHGLVENNLAACVNIIPQVTSVYRWEGKVNEDAELLLMLKTRTTKVDELVKYVRKNHPYEVCEVISTPIQNGNPPYLKWIGENVPE